MRELIIVGVGMGMLALAGCSPEPVYICDYDREWDKLDTVEDTCSQPEPTLFEVIRDKFVPDPRDPREPDSDPDPGDPDDDPTPPGDDPGVEDRPSRGNNGLGNGDQTAPGRSLNRNKAENESGNPGHRSGKPQNSN